MICVPGHGRGVDDIIGIDDKGQDRDDKSGYQHDFALQVVETGIAAIAIEPIAFGARRDPRNARRRFGHGGLGRAFQQGVMQDLGDGQVVMHGAYSITS